MKPVSVVAKLKVLLSRRDRRRASFLLLLVVVNACLQVVSVASIMPFTAVMASPKLIYTNAVLSSVFVALQFSTQKDFLAFLGLLAFTSITLAQVFKVLTNYCQIKFCLLQEYAIANKLFASFLDRPYLWLLQQDTAALGKNLLSDIHQVVQGILLPLLVACSQVIVTLLLFGLIFMADPKAALVAAAVFGFIYIVMYKYAKPRLDRIGHSHFDANEKRHLIASDALGAAREIKVGGLEQGFISRFSVHSLSYAVNQANAQAFLQLPRSVVELIAIGGMLLMVVYSITRADSLVGAIPLTALYAFAAYRLMPALQQIYSSLSEARTNVPALVALHEQFKQLEPSEKRTSDIQPVSFHREIRMEDVHFSYPSSATPTLNGLTLSIKAGSSIGMVGRSGSGKSTAAAILIGLLSPQSGRVTVDGEVITQSNIAQWRNTIGYVPQQIYLSNDTVAANIAFGIAADQIDRHAVERAAIAAQLHEFVCHSLPRGYDTMVGEKGVRLSGGQRQRIAIARALYKDPKVLVLDEATSALDNVTERIVIDALEALSGRVTTVVIAHRLTTVKRCTQIVLLDDGKVTEAGTYKQLLDSSATFRSMVSGEVRSEHAESQKIQA